MTLTLDKIRTVIDLIDEEILALLAERLELAKGTRALKEKVLDSDREKAILMRIRRTAKNGGRLRAKFVEQIYVEILAESRRVQEGRKI
jgi:chorismate mutase